MTTDRDRDYLRIVLPLDPLIDARRIVALRAAHLDEAGAAPSGEEVDLGTRRRELLTQLKRVRRDFWSAEEKQLAEKLSALDANDFLELVPEVVRLRQAAAIRGELDLLSDTRGQETPFLRLVRDLCVASPREAATLREAALAALSSVKSRDERRRRRDCRRITLRIVRELPRLFEFERAWFAAVVSHTGWRATCRRIVGRLPFSFLVALPFVWLPGIAGLQLPWGLR